MTLLDDSGIMIAVASQADNILLAIVLEIEYELLFLSVVCYAHTFSFFVCKNSNFLSFCQIFIPFSFVSSKLFRNFATVLRNIDI